MTSTVTALSARTGTAAERRAAARDAYRAEFLTRIAWANQTAREIVNAEFIYIPGKDNDDTADEPEDDEPEAGGGFDEWGW